MLWWLQHMRILPPTIFFLLIPVYLSNPVMSVARFRSLQIHPPRKDDHTASVLCPLSHDWDIYTFNIVYSICGSNRKEELLRSIHSLRRLIDAVKTPEKMDQGVLYHIHIITDGGITAQDLPSVQFAGLCYQLHEPSPKAAALFAPCSTQRLYLHEHRGFDEVQQAIYLDMDTLWMDIPDRFNQEISKMEDQQALFAMALETTDKNGNASWYKGGLSRDLPFYGDFGLNAGVMLLNLKRLRAAEFSRERDKIIRHFYPKRALPLGDQDVLNAYTFKFPKDVFVMSCVYNFRSDSACYNGFPVILHGNRNLKNDMNSTYSTLYKLFGKLQI